MFVATDRTRLLVDAGLSRREVQKRLAAIGEDLAALDAILITHEHSDHVSGLVPLSKGLNGKPVPVYLTQKTAPYIDWAETTPVVEAFQAGCGFTIGDIDIASFTIPHDAADPVGYTLTSQGIKVAIATDLGYVTDSLRVHLQGADCAAGIEPRFGDAAGGAVSVVGETASDEPARTSFERSGGGVY